MVSERAIGAAAVGHLHRNMGRNRDSPTVEKVGDSWHIEMTADEEWCPEQNCTFRVTYSLSRE